MSLQQFNDVHLWLTSKRGVHLFRSFLFVMRTPHYSRRPRIFSLKYPANDPKNHWLSTQMWCTHYGQEEPKQVYVPF